MRVYTKCTSCKHEISFWTNQKDRVEFKMQNGDFIQLRCKKCLKTGNYEIQKFKARESIFAQIIALSIFIIGTPLIFIFLWEYLTQSSYIYLIIAVVIPILIPSLIYGLITKDERNKVQGFNRS